MKKHLHKAYLSAENVTSQVATFENVRSLLQREKELDAFIDVNVSTIFMGK